MFKVYICLLIDHVEIIKLYLFIFRKLWFNAVYNVNIPPSTPIPPAVNYEHVRLNAAAPQQIGIPGNTITETTEMTDDKDSLASL